MCIRDRYYTTDKPKRKKARRTRKKAIKDVVLPVKDAPASEDVIESKDDEVVEQTLATEDVSEAKVDKVDEEAQVLEETAEVNEETKGEADNSENKEKKGE